MVKLLLEPYTLLLLDEPTNHLDMRSKDILKQALIKYDGTLIVVSHDRDFLDGLVTKVYEFRHNRIKEHLGGIYDFLRRKKIDNLRDIEIRDKAGKESKSEENTSNKQKYLDKKEYDRNLRKLRKRLEDSELKIEDIERQLLDMDNTLNISLNPEESADIYKNYQNLKLHLNEEMNKWTALSHEVDEFIKNTDNEGYRET
jgi:ATP-binding cassette subfamily F protein 3